MTQKELVLDLLRKSQQRLNGVAAIFSKAGIDLQGNIPSVQQFIALNQSHPSEFEEVVYFLYPEQRPSTKACAVAWAGIVGAACDALGGFFKNISLDTSDSQLAQLEYEKALALQQAAQQKKTLYIVLGLISGVAVIGIALFFLMSSRK